MHAVSTNQIADILHFNDNVSSSITVPKFMTLGFLVRTITVIFSFQYAMLLRVIRITNSSDHKKVLRIYPYSIQMREIRTRKYVNADTFYAVVSIR